MVDKISSSSSSTRPVRTQASSSQPGLQEIGSTEAVESQARAAGQMTGMLSDLRIASTGTLPGRLGRLPAPPSRPASPEGIIPAVSHLAENRHRQAVEPGFPPEFEAQYGKLQDLVREEIGSIAKTIQHADAIRATPANPGTVQRRAEFQKLFSNGLKNTDKKIRTINSKINILDKANRDAVMFRLDREMANPLELLEACKVYQKLMSEMPTEFDDSMKKAKQYRENKKASSKRQVGAILNKVGSHLENLKNAVARLADHINLASESGVETELADVFAQVIAQLREPVICWFEETFLHHQPEVVHYSDRRQMIQYLENDLSKALQTIFAACDLHDGTSELMSRCKDDLGLMQHAQLTSDLKKVQIYRDVSATSQSSAAFSRIECLLNLHGTTDSKVWAALRENIPCLTVLKMMIDWKELQVSDKPADSITSAESRIDMCGLFFDELTNFSSDLEEMIQKVEKVEGEDHLKTPILTALRDMGAQKSSFENIAYVILENALRFRESSDEALFPESLEIIRENNRNLMQRTIDRWAKHLAPNRAALPPAPFEENSVKPSKNSRQKKARKQRLKLEKQENQDDQLLVSDAVKGKASPKIEARPPVAAMSPQGKEVAAPGKSGAADSSLDAFIDLANQYAVRASQKFEAGLSGGSARSIDKWMCKAVNEVEQRISLIENHGAEPSKAVKGGPAAGVEAAEIEELKTLSARLQARSRDMVQAQNRRWLVANPLDWLQQKTLWDEPDGRVYLERNKRKRLAEVRPDGSPYFEPYRFDVPMPEELVDQAARQLAKAPPRGDDAMNGLWSLQFHPHYRDANAQTPDFIKMKFNGASHYISSEGKIRDTMAWLRRRAAEPASLAPDAHR